MPLGNYKRQLGNDEPLIVPMDSLQNKTTTPAVNLNMPENTFGMIRQGTEKLRSLEMPFLPKTSALRYLPGELAAETERLIIPQSEVEGLMQIAPIGMVAKSIGKTPIGKKVAEIGAKEISKIAPSIVKGISKFTQKEIPQDLAQEARKYKSADEFVNSFEKQFHGSPRADLQEIGFGTGVRSNPFMGTSKEVKSPAIFFTKDKGVADTFAKNRVEYLATKNEKGVPTVYERFINKKGILDLTKPRNVDDVFEKLGISAEEEILGTIPNYGTGEAFSDLLEAGHLEMGSLFQIFDQPNLVKKFKDAGYGGVRLIEKGNLGESTAIFDPKKAFSKSQLTDIWNQATKKNQ